MENNNNTQLLAKIEGRYHAVRIDLIGVTDEDTIRCMESEMASLAYYLENPSQIDHNLLAAYFEAVAE